MKFLPAEKQLELIQRGAEEIIPKEELQKKEKILNEIFKGS